MRKTVGRKCRKLFTMIELMIVVIIVAILAASAVPLYRSAVSRSYDGEVVAALSTIRSAQRMYYAEYDIYSPRIQADGEVPYLSEEITADDFRDMQYVNVGDPFGTGDFSVYERDGGQGFYAEWAGDIPGYDYTQVYMDEAGNITRNESEETFP